MLTNSDQPFEGGMSPTGKTTGNASDSKEWVLTGGIDFVDPRSAGELVLQAIEPSLDSI